MAMARCLLPLVLLALLLGCALPSAEARRGASATEQFNHLADFLGKKYPKLLGALNDTGLVPALKAAIEGGTKVTILAPSDGAFNNFKPACTPAPDLKGVLLDHVIPQRLGAVPFIIVPPGFTVPTLGADSVTKLTWFLRLGIKKGGDVKVTAQVTRPNRFATSRIVLHGINAVLGFCP